MSNVAIPPDRVPVPSGAEPSLNVTVPVGVPAAGEVGDTVAVNVTDWPASNGFADDDTDVDVLPWLTVCESADEVLPAKLVSPTNPAVIEREPTANEDVENEAMP